MCIIPRFLLQCLFDSQVGEHLFCMLLSQRIRESIILVFLDFPYWIRFAHFINIIFITLLIRSGIEILSALPKLYFNDHAKPGSEWIKFTKKKMPQDRLWISLEEEESFPSLVALPGHRNLGLGRHWHFFSIVFWIANGLHIISYYLQVMSGSVLFRHRGISFPKHFIQQ